MKNSRRIIIAASLCGLILSACAKRRKTEPVFDFDGNRFDKATLLQVPQWKYKATLINTSQLGGFGIVGESTNMRIGRFDFSQDRLAFYNVVKPYSDAGASSWTT